ncbi:single strand DNA binding protein [Vibrio phage K225]|nr:hypothetical protein PODOV044v1_p0029 [Vibrio phage 23E28.1]QZI92062.1 hypothetical protein PODOV045v1_p0020 [Vibrio phage 69E27.1]
MAQFDNTNRGTLGKNKSPKHDRSPHYTGQMNFRGQDFWIAGWTQEDFMSDDEYISIAVTNKKNENHKGSGRLNPNKTKMGRQPDMKGMFILDGVELEIAAWMKKNNSDQSKFLSLTIKDGYGEPAVAQRNTNQPHGNDTAKPQPQYNEPPMDFDDDIPF